MRPWLLLLAFVVVAVVVLSQGELTPPVDAPPPQGEPSLASLEALEADLEEWAEGRWPDWRWEWDAESNTVVLSITADAAANDTALTSYCRILKNIARETAAPGMQDPSLAAWWAEAAKFRRGGVDRILIPASFSPTIAALNAAGTRGVFYSHELVQVVPGRALAYLEAVREVAVPAYAEFGFALVGAFRTAMRNDSECLLLWAISEPNHWAAFEAAQDDGFSSWRKACESLVLDWQRILLVDAPLSPLRLGRQPKASDRVPLDEIP